MTKITEDSTDATVMGISLEVQINISVYGESGFLYLHVYKSSSALLYSYEINGANSNTEEHSYVCYDESRRCFFHALGDKLTWLGAKAKCLDSNQGLAPYQISKDEKLCIPTLPDGNYWIGMIWSMPVSTTTISTTAGLSTMQTTTTIRTTSIVTTETLTPTTEIKSKTVALYTSDSVQPTPSDNKPTLIAVSVIIPVVLIATVVSVVIFYKKKLMCFKGNENWVGVDKSIKSTTVETPSADPLIATTAIPNIPPGSTMARL
ncbi:hypothetical protein CHS0354_023438 [Potamilus streckersoni]|uniref:C-type lectin domain-containing protein n=1 Tax=Potamilus streckersoni TaxID=2493646 RepID=A0AAE0RYG5_9BIVA|nr:hypothetical protein CHS0354_023438 [Potamilus streckersoni]